VRTAQDEIQAILRRSGGVIGRRQHPEFRTSIDWMLRTRRLRPMLPGVYVDPRVFDDIRSRIAAAAIWAPDGIITEHAAAWLSFWPGLPVPTVSLALPRQRRCTRGFCVQKRVVDPEQVRQVEGIPITSPAQTVIDLVRITGSGDPIDTALRARATTIAELNEVFASLPHRRGNPLCAILLDESRDEPWSGAERALHRLLHSAGIDGWVANKAVVVGAQRRAADVRFDRIRLAIEVDGYELHSRRQVFEDDRVRQNAFVLDGWTVLRFTARQIEDQPEEVITQIRQAIEMLTLNFMTSLRPVRTR
jgi:very-short-patch-repair endonuclease